MGPAGIKWVLAIRLIRRMRKILVLPALGAILGMGPALAAADPPQGLVVAGGVTSAGLSAGLKYRFSTPFQAGIRAAYFPGVHAFDLHVHYRRDKGIPNYLGPELIYLHDTVVLASKEFPSHRWLALQWILGQEMALSRRLGLGLEGGLGLTLYRDVEFRGAGAPIDFPLSVIFRLEFVFGS